MMKIGPLGANIGIIWDDKGGTEIVQIFVSHDTKIHSLQFQYANENGELVLSDTHGHIAGDNFNAVHLNYPSEYVISISGQYGYGSIDGYNTQSGMYHYSSSRNDHSQTCLTSITFGTNLGTYGPFGEPSRNDTGFMLHLGSNRQFGGFHGAADTVVRSIGMYVKPISTLDVTPKLHYIKDNTAII